MMPSPTPLLSIRSHSSSAYSTDDASDTNTTGTQIHHKLELSSAIHDSNDGHMEDSPVTAASNHTSYAVEYMENVLARGNAFNHEYIPVGRLSQDDSGIRQMLDVDAIGPRPSTPPRRRPRITSTDNISLGSYHNTLGSISSVASPSHLDDRVLLYASTDEPKPLQLNKSNLTFLNDAVFEDDTTSSAGPSNASRML